MMKKPFIFVWYTLHPFVFAIVAMVLITAHRTGNGSAVLGCALLMGVMIAISTTLALALHDLAFPDED